MKMRYLALTLVCVGGIEPVSAQVDFRTDVEPIFREKCWECHGPTEQKSSLRLDRKRYALAGGSRETIVPGAPDKSRLYRSIAGLAEIEMPQEGSLTPGQIDLVRQWIAEGAVWPDDPPDVHWVVDERVAPLVDAVKAGDFEVVRAAVLAHPELASAQEIHGATVLTATSLYGTTAQLKWLLSRKADPNLATEAGHTALMFALDDPTKVKLLLDAGANANARTQSGRTTLQQAADRKRSAPVLRLLLKHGATFEPGEGDPLIQVTRNGDLASMKLLVALRGGKFPKPALKNAALSNCVECVRLVLASKPDEEVVHTVLAGSATMISNEVLGALLEAGADPNASAAATPGDEAKTVLMQTVYSDYADPKRVKLLLDAGADVNKRTPRGNTALAEARKKGSTEIVSLLVSAGAKEPR